MREFFIVNPYTNAQITVTVQGTKLADSSYTMSFGVSTGLYLVGSAYDIDFVSGNWLECQPNCLGNYQYTWQSYGFSSHEGDTIWFWCQNGETWTPAIVHRNPGSIAAYRVTPTQLWRAKVTRVGNPLASIPPHPLQDRRRAVGTTPSDDGRSPRLPILTPKPMVSPSWLLKP